MAKVETRNSFVQTHHTTFLGVRAGFEFKFPVRCGIGYYWTLTNFDSKFYRPADFGLTDPTAQPKMRYAIGYVDYSFYKEDDWRFQFCDKLRGLVHPFGNQGLIVEDGILSF